MFFNTIHDKREVLDKLREFVKQPPRLNPADYFSAHDTKTEFLRGMMFYRQDKRRIEAHRRDALEMLNLIERMDGITARQLIEASKDRRLQVHKDGPHVVVDFTTCQNWSTEYRAAVCGLLATVLWQLWKENMNHNHLPKSIHLVSLFSTKILNPPLLQYNYDPHQ